MQSSQLVLTPLSFSIALAYKPCPLLGPVFSAPTYLCDASTFQATLDNLKSTLDHATATGTTQYSTWPRTSNSFSLGIFDTTSAGQLFTYEYTSPQTKNSTKGVKELTGDTIYRLGSLSKLITAYLFLIEAGPSYWNHPVTEFVPELAEAAAKCSALTDPVDCIDWDDITLGALASHMAGLPRDFSNFGMPWEILRAINLTDHVFDLYTKPGGLYAYSSYLILSPDYNVGFVALAAGDDNSAMVEQIADTVVAAIFPALEDTAGQQAQEKYAGTYNSTEEGLDSSVVLTTQAGEPGLKVEQWISNGTNVALLLAGLYGAGSAVDIRLYPTGLVQQTSASIERVSLRAVIESLNSVPDGGFFSNDCGTWFNVDNWQYGSVGLDEILFEVEDGKAVGISPRAFRTTLKKSE